MSRHEPPEGWDNLTPEEGMAWGTFLILGVVAWFVIFGKACMGGG